MESERIKKVNEVLQHELSKIILQEIELKKGVLATISKVDTTKDLNLARVSISVFPEKETDFAVDILNRQAYNLHQMLNKRMNIRRVPKLKFIKQTGLEQPERLNQLLDEIKAREYTP